jgi:hypothetical protein
MSETDDQTPRRPPTIELAATEVDDAAEKPSSGPTETAGASGAENEDAASGADARRSAAGASGRFSAYVAGAAIGAAVMAAIAAGIWFAGLIPMSDAKSSGQAANTPPPSASGPVPSPAPPAETAATTQAAPGLSARLDKIERAVETPRTDPALGSRIAAAEAQAKSLGDALAALRGRLDEIAATGAGAAKQADAALNAAQAAKTASEAASKTDVQRSDFDALAQRIMALESATKALAAATAPLAAGADDRAARLTIAAEALRAALERGEPYQAELATLHALGVDQNATAPLEAFAATGVPSAAALSRELEALVPAMQDAAAPTRDDATFLGRLTANAQKLVRISPAGAPRGNDPAAVVARIRFDAAHADIAAALADINTLPDPAKSLAAAWSKKAAAREAALAAGRQIAADALAALGKPPAR